MEPNEANDFAELANFLTSFAPPVRPRSSRDAPHSFERRQEIEKALAEPPNTEDRLAMFARIANDESAISYLAERLRGASPEEAEQAAAT